MYSWEGVKTRIDTGVKNPYRQVQQNPQIVISFFAFLWNNFKKSKFPWWQPKNWPFIGSILSLFLISKIFSKFPIWLFSPVREDNITNSGSSQKVFANRFPEKMFPGLNRGQSYLTLNSSFFWFSFLSLAFSKFRQYFLMLKTLNLNNKKRKKSSFYEEKSLVGLTPGLQIRVFRPLPSYSSTVTMNCVGGCVKKRERWEWK